MGPVGRGQPRQPSTETLLAAGYKLVFAHDRILNTYTPMQNRFAGINPSCPVRNPITQIMPLLTPATASPVHRFRPTRTVERTVRQHDK